MTATETVEQAWKRIFGTTFTYSNDRCMWFAAGFNAGRGRA